MLEYLRNGRHETHAAWQRNLMFAWVFASEGDEIIILDMP